MSYYVYIIQCEDGYIYTGLTASLKKRLVEHKSGMSRLTKNRGKITLVYKETYPTRVKAAKREKEIKGWRREKKEKLIKSLH